MDDDSLCFLAGTSCQGAEREFKFVGLKDFGRGPVAEFTNEHYDGAGGADSIGENELIRFDKTSLNIRIENAKQYGDDATEELKGMAAIKDKKEAMKWTIVAKKEKTPSV